MRPKQAWDKVRGILRPDASYFALAVVYGIAISLLTLTVPLCVQILIETVANVGQVQQVAVLGLVLFGLLALSGAFVAMQTYLMELFQRRFFCRITSEIVMRNVYARFAQMESINREELVNRYFEIMTIQKNVPKLFVGGTALLLQTAVGFVVVSAYHPLLFVLNAVIAMIIALVLRIWGPGAIRNAVWLSKSKYAVAHRLQELARANAFFKGERSISHALDVAEGVTADYIEKHRSYFYYKFSQTIAMLVLYSAASALLLGLGGWLVIQGELTLGQLVASELILSAVFVGLSRSGEYLDLYYEACAAVDKLSMFFSIPLESRGGRLELEDERAGIRFDDVVWGDLERPMRIDFELDGGGSYLIGTHNSIQKAIVDLLQRHRDPNAGAVVVGGHDLADVRLHSLRDRVMVIDNFGVLERTIGEYLSLGDPAITRVRMREALEATGAEEVVDRLPDGLDTELGPFGYPLTRTQTLRLKLAAVLLAEPRVLLLTEVFDTISRDRRQIFENLRARSDMTVICFSNRRDMDAYDGYLYCDWEQTHRFDSLQDLIDFEERMAREAERVA